MDELRSIPSVDALLESAAGQQWIRHYGRSLTVQVIREVLDRVRTVYLEDQRAIPNEVELIERISSSLDDQTAPTLYPVINASGVIVHTNLGRAPLCADALRAVKAVGGQYSTLEFDMDRGTRGSRLKHAEDLLCQLLDAEGALAVNNNASAVMLVLRAFTAGKKVLIARTQLVEIGGGFRVPDVMRQSGAHLVEVGTTNKVHLFDYQDHIDEETAAVLRAHRSNFALVGFTSEPPLEAIAETAHQHNLMVIDDLGSGALLDTAQFGLQHEPMVQESLAGGADLVCFSGDKLLGGPQAGLIVGRGDLIQELKRHPLARAIRADKMALAALSATLLHYRKGDAVQKVPVWQMISTPLEIIEQRARDWQAALGEGNIVEARSTVGGGSLPGETLPTYALALEEDNPQRFLAALRQGSPAVIARVQDDQVLLDPRTVLPGQEDGFLHTLQIVLDSEV